MQNILSRYNVCAGFYMVQLQTGAEIQQWWSVSGLMCQMVSAGIVPNATQERASGTKVSSQNHVFLCRSGFC